jgi:hypothetical protein
LVSGIGTGTGSSATVTLGAGGNLLIANGLNVGSATGAGALFAQTGSTLNVSGGILAIGGAGSSITVDGGSISAAMLNVPVGNVTLNSGSLTPTTLNASSTGIVHYNAGTLVTTNLNLSTGGQVLFSPGINKVLRTANASITGASKIDLSDNKMIVQSTPTGTWNGSAYTGVTGFIAAGRNGGTLPLWDGSGIVTSQSDATGGNFTSIGVALASDVRPNTVSETATWAGQTVTGTDTLVMYTYGGDANLDGKLNIDDYVRIDSGIASSATGWSNGDFNYDGVVNIDDYTTVIDLNIGNQNGIFPTTTGSNLTGVVAIPEPASFTILALAAAGWLASSRKKRQRGCRKSNPSDTFAGR